MQFGIHVTWEWAEKCQGWRLPFTQRLQKKYQPHFAVTHGCRVDLRDRQVGSLLKKGWKLMTTSEPLAQQIDLRCKCPRDFKHGKCEGSTTGETAYYTDFFAKRVAKAILNEVSHERYEKMFHGQLGLVER